jgi:cytoskeleton protein RodZ
MWVLIEDKDPAKGRDPWAESSPGAQLTAGRERAGWSLERLAAELCLPVERLKALEADDHAAFGGVVFVRGYLRRAAALLGIPPESLVATFERCCDTTRPADLLPAPLPGRAPRRGPPGWLAPLSAGAAVAAALGLTWWMVPFDRSSGAPVEAPAALEFHIPEEPRPVVALDAPAEPRLAMVQDAPPESAPEDVDTALEPVMVEYQATAATATPVPGMVELRFEFVEDCWVEVTDADGRRLAYRLHRGGEVARLRGKAPVSIFLGNAEGARLAVDGTPVALRPAATRAGTARLTVGGGAG